MAQTTHSYSYKGKVPPSKPSGGPQGSVGEDDAQTQDAKDYHGCVPASHPSLAGRGVTPGPRVWTSSRS